MSRLNNISLDQIEDIEIQKMVRNCYIEDNDLPADMNEKTFNTYIRKAVINTKYANFSTYHYLFDYYNEYVYFHNQSLDEA